MNPRNIGKRLAALRGNKSQTAAANEMGIGVSALSMYECGQRIPSDKAKVKIARYYGLTVGELFFEEKCHVMCQREEVN